MVTQQITVSCTIGIKTIVEYFETLEGAKDCAHSIAATNKCDVKLIVVTTYEELIKAG